MTLMSMSLALGLAACTPRVQHKVEPIEIHVRHDVTIRHVDERLEEFFAFQEKDPAATQPAPQAAPPSQAPAAPDGAVTPQTVEKTSQ